MKGDGGVQDRNVQFSFKPYMCCWSVWCRGDPADLTHKHTYNPSGRPYCLSISNFDEMSENIASANTGACRPGRKSLRGRVKLARSLQSIEKYRIPLP